MFYRSVLRWCLNDECFQSFGNHIRTFHVVQLFLSVMLTYFRKIKLKKKNKNQYAWCGDMNENVKPPMITELISS